MKSFMFDGREYRSLRLFAQDYKVSYQKLRRLVRHYISASKDPAVACEWLLKRKPLLLTQEGKTSAYYVDMAKGKARAYKSLEKKQQVYESNLVSQVEDYLQD